MIIEPDFYTHWKTQLLCGLTDVMGPMYIQRLWLHGQNRKTDRFEKMSPMVVKAICGYAGDADNLMSALVESGFVEVDGDFMILHGFRERNAKLFANWTNGPSGGRPPKTHRQPKHNPTETHEEPTDNPNITQQEPTKNPLVTDKKREDKIEKNRPKERNSTVVSETVAGDGPLSAFCEKILRGWPNWGLEVPLTKWEMEAASAAFNAFNRRLDDRLVMLLQEYFQTRKKNAAGRDYPKPSKRQAVFEQLHDWVENAEQFAKEWRKPLTPKGWARKQMETKTTKAAPDPDDGITEEGLNSARAHLGIQGQ